MININQNQELFIHLDQTNWVITENYPITTNISLRNFRSTLSVNEILFVDQSSKPLKKENRANTISVIP